MRDVQGKTTLLSISHKFLGYLSLRQQILKQKSQLYPKTGPFVTFVLEFVRLFQSHSSFMQNRGKNRFERERGSFYTDRVSIKA